MLNSRRRRCTLNSSTLKMPMAANPTAAPANAPTSCARNRGRAVDSASTSSIVRTRETDTALSIRPIAAVAAETIEAGADAVCTTSVANPHGFCAYGT